MHVDHWLDQAVATYQLANFFFCGGQTLKKKHIFLSTSQHSQFTPHSPVHSFCLKNKHHLNASDFQMSANGSIFGKLDENGQV